MRDTVHRILDDSDIETGVLRGDLSMGDSRAVGLSDEGQADRALEGCTLCPSSLNPPIALSAAGVEKISDASSTFFVVAMLCP